MTLPDGQTNEQTDGRTMGLRELDNLWRFVVVTYLLSICDQVWSRHADLDFIEKAEGEVDLEICWEDRCSGFKQFDISLGTAGVGGWYYW